MNDPWGFAQRLVNGVLQGFQDFFGGLKDTLPDKLMGWLTKGMEGLPAFPTTWDLTHTLNWVLEYSGLTWDNLTAKVKEAVGESNATLAAKAVEVVQKVVKGGDGMVALLKEEAFGLTPKQLLDEALRIGLEQITRVFVPKAVEFLMTKLVVPASGVLVALYDGLRWLADNATAMGQVGTKILEGMEALASGSPTAVQDVARAVKTAFDGMIVPGLDFVAKQAKLDGVKAAAVAAIGGVKEKIVDPRLRQFLTALVNKLKAAIGIQPGESTQQAGQIGPRVERMVQGVKYQLWVAVRGG
ncbi:MAG: hypothetical protein U0840_28350 [Gemmataceae bacterium]